MTGALATILGTLNPLRYRGYVYDIETGYYYLQSRYYDPEIGRFINADAFVSTGQGLLSNNMFAYCGNDPVNKYDPSGHMMVQQKVLGGYGGYVGGGVGAADLLMPLVVVTAALGALYETTKEDLKHLSKALVDTAKARYENSQPAIHHVVPQGCSCESAQKSRNILKENLISVQNPINLVIINYETHKQLHSSQHTYCKKVETVLIAFSEDNNVRGGLALLKLEIAFLALSKGSYFFGVW